jgi:hypothetical protein
MVMNKKGIIKIIEASIAVLIVASILMVNYNQDVSVEKPDYSENARDILEELSRNRALRSLVLTSSGDIGDSSEIMNFINEKKPVHLSASAKVCQAGSACGISSLPNGDVFSAERIISSNMDNYGPKTIRLFLWREQ